MKSQAILFVILVVVFASTVVLADIRFEPFLRKTKAITTKIATQGTPMATPALTPVSSPLPTSASLTAAPDKTGTLSDSELFNKGFHAYQQLDFDTTVSALSELLRTHPTSTFRDMSLFWLSKAYFKKGNIQEAAIFLSSFSEEYPTHPMLRLADEALLAQTNIKQKN